MKKYFSIHNLIQALAFIVCAIIIAIGISCVLTSCVSDGDPILADIAGTDTIASDTCNVTISATTGGVELSRAASQPETLSHYYLLITTPSQLEVIRRIESTSPTFQIDVPAGTYRAIIYAVSADAYTNHSDWQLGYEMADGDAFVGRTDFQIGRGNRADISVRLGRICSRINLHSDDVRNIDFDTLRVSIPSSASAYNLSILDALQRASDPEPFCFHAADVIDTDGRLALSFYMLLSSRGSNQITDIDFMLHGVSQRHLSFYQPLKPNCVSNVVGRYFEVEGSDFGISVDWEYSDEYNVEIR